MLWPSASSCFIKGHGIPRRKKEGLIDLGSISSGAKASSFKLVTRITWQNQKFQGASLWDLHSPQPCWGPGSTEAPPFGLRKCPFYLTSTCPASTRLFLSMFLCPYHISHFYHSSVRATSTIYIMEINRHSFSGKQLHLSSCKCHSTFPTCHTFREEQWLAHWQAWGNGPFGCHFLTIDTAPVDLVEVVPISKESLYFKKQWVAELR